MNKNLIAVASIDINASNAEVCKALIDPGAIEQYMFGTNVVSDWKEGSPIVWRGEWRGKPYEDKGVIIRFSPNHTLQYSHFSPLSGQSDKPENYHMVTIELSDARMQTHVTLSQDNNSTEDERKHSEENWEVMLVALKKFVESST